MYYIELLFISSYVFLFNFMIDISIVSHRHEEFLPELLERLSDFQVSKVIVTHNLQPRIAIKPIYNYELIQIQNKHPKGFSENHNRAFTYSDNEYFCILNPDITFLEDPFLKLLDCIKEPGVAIVGPLVLDPDRMIEDSYRRFPTPITLLCKLFSKSKKVFQCPDGDEGCYPDWLAGMFLLVPRKFYINLNGFDQSYYLYYEDVDLSIRAWKSGYKVKLCRQAQVIHNAQRQSHKDFIHFIWHLKSILLFFFKHLFRYPLRSQ